MSAHLWWIVPAHPANVCRIDLRHADLQLVVGCQLEIKKPWPQGHNTITVITPFGSPRLPAVLFFIGLINRDCEGVVSSNPSNRRYIGLACCTKRGALTLAKASVTRVERHPCLTASTRQSATQERLLDDVYFGRPRDEWVLNVALRRGKTVGENKKMAA
jgi:hypothetical protein